MINWSHSCRVYPVHAQLSYFSQRIQEGIWYQIVSLYIASQFKTKLGDNFDSVDISAKNYTELLLLFMLFV